MQYIIPAMSTKKQRIEAIFSFILYQSALSQIIIARCSTPLHEVARREAEVNIAKRQYTQRFVSLCKSKED